MDTALTHPARHLDPAHLNTIFRQTLSLGVDLDGRGLHYQLPGALSPEQRLAFGMAVYFTGGLYVLIDADRGFLCVEKIVHCTANLKKARRNGAYLSGHAFAALYEALGYGCGDTVGFDLIEPSDLACVEGFMKGFGDYLAQSLEADVMRAVRALRGAQAADDATLLANLRHFINDHKTVVTVIDTIV